MLFKKNNLTQKVSYEQALKALEKIECATMLNFWELEKILENYKWLADNKIKVEATYKDIISLFFDTNDFFTEEGNKIVKNILNELK